MSYEGYDNFLCRNGHLRGFDAHDDMDVRLYCCPACGAGAAWWNSVDETNGIDEDTGHCPGYVELELATPAIYETCSLGHRHVTCEATYKIPPKGVGHHV